MALPTPPAPHAPVHGELIGPWRVQERVDSGSFGIIFKVVRASDPSSGPYAMKMAAQPDDARFEREAVLLSLVNHPGLPRYHDSGTWLAPSGRGYPFVVMQWVEGVPLYQWARTTGRFLTSRQALRQLAQVARALEALHEYGLHRDVKGDNILVRADGSAVLLDVGACWLPDGRALTEGALPPGTPQYRSPQALEYRECCRLDPEAHYEAGPADDVYALGVTAYRLVTGMYPPEPGGSGRLLPPSALASVAPELEALILRMLSYEPEVRGSAGALAQAMEGAANAAGWRKMRKLDAELLPSRSVLPTQPSRLPGPWVWRARRVALSFAAVAISLLVLGGLIVVLHSPSERVEALPPYLALEGEVEVTFAADAGVAELALSEVQDVPRGVYPSVMSLGRSMPTTPFPGQRKPPCDPRAERVIIGACWIGPIGDEKPPCGARMFDYEDRCYLASFDQARQPTSGQP